ncbi:MAG TPA: PIN domain-containing protein [Thermoanaerobaculia bacterium]
MIERLAVDSNAVIEWLRAGGTEPFAFRDARWIVLPLPVVGELYAGVFASKKRDAHLLVLEDFLTDHELLSPDGETARVYGRLRAPFQKIGQSKMNDVWIAALCIQHDLPLLTNDRGFDSFPELRVIHW